jgi:hypothetical protein
MLFALAIPTTRPRFPWRVNNVMECLRRMAASVRTRPVIFGADDPASP